MDHKAGYEPSVQRLAIVLKAQYGLRGETVKGNPVSGPPVSCSWILGGGLFS